MQRNDIQKVAAINSKKHKKPMLRGQTEPGLVASYDIWPGNGAGLFFQPRARTGPNSRKHRLMQSC